MHLTFEVDGKNATIIPRPLASPENLRKRMAFPPDFSPRQFTATWRGESGTVRCRLIIGLTPRHSGETSGVYLYGNGRMFARALRTRPLGYGESGNAVLRDHPQCWRIHAYAFLEADDGSDIPWQAPLKDGLSENHIITTRLREMFKEAVSPYSRFAKFAKASELVPFTTEWEGLRSDQKAEVLFGRSTHAMALFEDLPEGIRDFEPPTVIETVCVDGVAGEEAIKKLDSHAKNLRQIIKKRDTGGPILEVDVLRALSPSAFLDEKKSPKAAKRASVVALPRKVRVSVEVDETRLKQLRQLFGASTDGEAVRAAIAAALTKITTQVVAESATRSAAKPATRPVARHPVAKAAARSRRAVANAIDIEL